MLLHVVYAITLVLGTTLVHTGCTFGVLSWFRSLPEHPWALRSNMTRAFLLGAVVIGMFVVACLESILWAGLYWALGALPTMADAVYFSLVTFTTLGYGDITLEEQWRLLAAFEAANGIIILGWTTALIVAAVQRLIINNSPDAEGS